MLTSVMSGPRDRLLRWVQIPRCCRPERPRLAAHVRELGQLAAIVGEHPITADLLVTTLPASLLTEVHAAPSRGLPKKAVTATVPSGAAPSQKILVPVVAFVVHAIGVTVAARVTVWPRAGTDT